MKRNEKSYRLVKHNTREFHGDLHVKLLRKQTKESSYEGDYKRRMVTMEAANGCLQIVGRIATEENMTNGRLSLSP